MTLSNSVISGLLPLPRSKDKEINLVSQEEFYNEAPVEISKPVSINSVSSAPMNSNS